MIGFDILVLYLRLNSINGVPIWVAKYWKINSEKWVSLTLMISDGTFQQHSYTKKQSGAERGFLPTWAHW
jgi:hypothetical protein